MCLHNFVQLSAITTRGLHLLANKVSLIYNYLRCVFVGNCSSPHCAFAQLFFKSAISHPFPYVVIFIFTLFHQYSSLPSSIITSTFFSLLHVCHLSSSGNFLFCVVFTACIIFSSVSPCTCPSPFIHSSCTKLVQKMEILLEASLVFPEGNIIF